MCRTKLVVSGLLGPSFELHQLVVKKDVVPTICNFTMERCKPAIGQEMTKNKRVTPAKQQAGELLGHFPSKRRFVFRFKTSFWKRFREVLLTFLSFPRLRKKNVRVIFLKFSNFTFRRYKMAEQMIILVRLTFKVIP